MTSKYYLVCLAIVGFGTGMPAMGKENSVTDIQFRAPLFCNNQRQTIAYIIVSFNINSFSKVTDIGYFTDGYPNMVGADFYSASKSTSNENRFTVELKKLVGFDAYNFGPQKSGKPAVCEVTLQSDWSTKLKIVGDVLIYESSDFDVNCTFPLDSRESCKSSKKLTSNLFLVNPFDGKKLPYESNFTFKTWKCKNASCN